jgi:hypothetical protein
MRKLIATALCAASLSMAACRPIHTEPLRSSNLQMYSVGQLGFVRGKTDFESAKRMMEKRGMTGISDDFYVFGKKIFHAISADYQTDIHIFEDNHYSGSIPVKCGSVLPYGYQLRLGESEGRLRLLALYRDPLEYTFQKKMARPARIDVFTHGDSFRFMKSIRMDGLSRAHSGLTRPIFVGHDLGMGIIFLARDNDGRVWDKAYILSVRGSSASIKAIPLSEAEGCSCVRDYIYGDHK